MTEDIKTPINSKSQVELVNSAFKQKNYEQPSTHSIFCQSSGIERPKEIKDLIVATGFASATELPVPVSHEATESPTLLPLQTKAEVDILEYNPKDFKDLMISPADQSPLVPIPFPSSEKSIHSEKMAGVPVLNGESLNLCSKSVKSISISSEETIPFTPEKPFKNVLQSYKFACLSGNDDESKGFYTQEPILNESQELNKTLPRVQIAGCEPVDSKGVCSKIVWPTASVAPSLHEKYLQKINQNLTIGLERLPEQRLERVFKNKRTSYSSKTSSNNLFNLMVVGQEGLGKSTFVNTLFQSQILKTGLDNSKLYFQEGADKRVFKEFADPLKDGPTKTTLINKTYVSLEEENVNLKLCIIDTPGIGDYSNNSFSWVPICKFIDSQFTQFMFNEEQPFRDIRVDSRVHCCLYFILPTSRGLSPLDLLSMMEIGKRVNLIPVIGKSDGLTFDELKMLKAQIKEIISKQHINICDLLLKDQKDSDLLIDYPFAVIGGKYYAERNKFGREYRHGFVDVMNTTYSEFSKLSDFIIKDNMIDLINSTSLYYEIWREKLLTFRFKKMAELLPVINNRSPAGKNTDSMLQQLIPDFTEAEISKIGVTNKQMSELNLQENSDSNGLDKYKVYSVITKKYLDQYMLDWDPVFIHKQGLLKKSFDDSVVAQEKKFKDWKKSLFNKQSKFNDEIESLHNKVKNLQKQCIKVEQAIKLQQK